MTPLAILVKILTSTGFKVVTVIVVILILIIIYMEFQKSNLEIKLKRQEIKINDRTLAGTL